MPFIQQNSPPPNRVISFNIDNFVGGLNNRSNQLEKNESPDNTNMSFADDTVMEKRKGIVENDTLDLIGSITYIGLFRPYTGTNQLVRASDTEIYAETTKIATVNGRVNATNYMGKFYFADGSDIQVYGTFPQASDTHTKIVGIAVNSDIVMKLVNPPAGFTPLGTTETKGVWAYDYDTRTCWYEPCQNEIDDTYKGSNVLPENPKYLAVHGDRMFISGSNVDDDNVFISDIGNAFYTPVYLPIQLPPNSDEVIGLKVFHNSVVVGRGGDAYVIYGNTNRTDLNSAMFRLRKINTHTGFASHGAVDQAHNHLFYLGGDGNVYGMHTTQTNTDILATTILNRTVDVFKHPIGATTANLPNAQSVFFQDEWLLCLGDKVLVYSYRHRAWTLYKFFNISITSLFVNNNILLLGTNTGQVVKFSTEYYDLGKPFKASWASRVFDMDNPSSFKQFREFFIVAHTFNDFNSDVNVRFEVDYSDVKDNYKVINQIAIWGKSVFGHRFINRNINASLPIVIGRRGRGIKAILSNGYDESGTVTTYTDLETFTPKYEGTLVYVTDEIKYYLYTNNEWVAQSAEDINQPMKVYEVNGDYELRGKR
jgi:hypothetical protein